MVVRYLAVPFTHATLSITYFADDRNALTADSHKTRFLAANQLAGDFLSFAHWASFHTLTTRFKLSGTSANN